MPRPDYITSRLYNHLANTFRLALQQHMTCYHYNMKSLPASRYFLKDSSRGGTGREGRESWYWNVRSSEDWSTCFSMVQICSTTQQTIHEGHVRWRISPAPASCHLHGERQISGFARQNMNRGFLVSLQPREAHTQQGETMTRRLLMLSPARRDYLARGVAFSPKAQPVSPGTPARDERISGEGAITP